MNNKDDMEDLALAVGDPKPTADLSVGAPSVLTVKETAKALRVSRWSVYQLIRSGKLATFKIGRRRCIPAASVHDLVARGLTAEADL